jgi:hypothetical protein
MLKLAIKCDDKDKKIGTFRDFTKVKNQTEVALVITELEILKKELYEIYEELQEDNE